MDVSPRSRRRLSLTTRVSILLAFTAIIPLLIAVISSEWLSRPQLVSQSATVLAKNAQTSTQLIDAYMLERLHDVQTISRQPFLRQFLVGNAAVKQEAFDELSSGDQRDANYDSWSILDTRGRLLVWYPTQPKLHGKYLISPDNLQQVQHTTTTVISDVFYNSNVSEASVDIYMPVITANATVVGIIRATLSLDYIWNIVNNQADNVGTYGLIVDRNGVRIAYTNTDISNITQPANLFTAVAPLSAQMQRRVADENLYGKGATGVPILADTTLANRQRSPSSASTFEMTPAEHQETYEAAQQGSTILPWTYYVFSPLSAITTIADQQLLSVSIIAVVVLFLAVLVGLGLGRYITQPILLAVTSLRHSSQALKTLATKEQVTATEQQWMIESSQVGLQSLQYYTNATGVAARRLNNVGLQLLQQEQYLDPHSQVKQNLKEVTATAVYIQNAAAHQDASSKDLATAIRVTTQVAEQLATGAESAASASLQLEQVVEQLREIVGR